MKNLKSIILLAFAMVIAVPMLAQKEEKAVYQFTD